MPPTPAPLIDPQLPLTRRERRAIIRAAWGRWLNDPAHTVLGTGGILGALFVFLFVPSLIEFLIGGHRWYHTLIWFALYVLAISGLLILFRRMQFAPCVYAELRARGYDVCSGCGYMLARLPDDRTRCPECGAERAAHNAST